MLILGSSSKPKIVNPAHIVQLELVKGRVSAYVKGTVKGEYVQVEDLSVRAPWTVLVRTTIGVIYINCKNFDNAINVAIGIAKTITPGLHVDVYEKELRTIYAKE